MKEWRKRRKKKTTGHPFGMKNLHSHWPFQNWLCSVLRYTSMTCLRRMILLARLVCQFLSWNKASEQSPSLTIKEWSTTQQGSLWDLSLSKAYGFGCAFSLVSGSSFHIIPQLLPCNIVIFVENTKIFWQW